MEKLQQYEGLLGRLHGTRDRIKESWNIWKEENPGGVQHRLKNLVSCNRSDHQDNDDDFSHIYRTKSRKELVRISAAVMGIEFSYAAETAFVSPTLLKIGVAHEHMTLVWALSPLIGFFLTPILGSLSDRCHSNFGRRRPFILMMSLGVLLGLILVPNGELLGYAFGDTTTEAHNTSSSSLSAHRTTGFSPSTANKTLDFTSPPFKSNENEKPSHTWAIFFTILGTVLLDFDADACQSPARAYLLDVTIPDDHARGLSTFTIMAGLGGFLGYALGGINWDVTFIGVLLGGHVRAVFTLITIIFIVCVSYTLTSFKEMPLSSLELLKNEDNNPLQLTTSSSYGSLSEDPGTPKPRPSIVPSANASLVLYLRSIVYMPHSLRMLCLTNLFCWMAHVCYSLYFTDFVGEAVFNGNPTSDVGDIDRERYESGVRFGCWGMSMYSLSCACYSTIIEKLITKHGAKLVYIGGLLFYSTGMFLMALTKHKIGVLVFSWTAGVMYSTLFTMPYLLVAHYHACGTFEVTGSGEAKAGTQIRGLGTDVAIVSSMVFLAQFILSMCMGTIVSVTGTTTTVVSVASFLAFCGAISATQVMYLEL